MKETLILIVMLFYPNGGYDKEMMPVTVEQCKVVDGVRIEDSSCGKKACLLLGEKRAAYHWGQFPGLNFGLICRDPINGEETTKGTGAGGGHPGLKFDERN